MTIEAEIKKLEEEIRENKKTKYSGIGMDTKWAIVGGKQEKVKVLKRWLAREKALEDECKKEKEALLKHLGINENSLIINKKGKTAKGLMLDYINMEKTIAEQKSIIEELKDDVKVCGVCGQNNAIKKIHELKKALSKSEAENEKLHNTGERLFACKEFHRKKAEKIEKQRKLRQKWWDEVVKMKLEPKITLSDAKEIISKPLKGYDSYCKLIINRFLREIFKSKGVDLEAKHGT